MTDHTTTLTVPDSPKAIRETLCVAQQRVGASPLLDGSREHMDLIGRLIDECDRHRPLGPDGKHNDRHTPTCGCADIPTPGPAWVTRQQLVTICRMLGLDPDEVRAVVVTSGAVVVERYARNEQGARYLVRRGWLRRRQPATTTDVFRVTDLMEE